MNAGKQMMVRRARDTPMTGNKRAFPPNVIDALTAGKMSVSPPKTAVTRDTTPSTPTTSSSTRLLPRSSPRLMKQKPKPKLIRRNSWAMQKVHVNKLAVSDFEKHALKRATKWYAQDRNHPSGLSAKEWDVLMQCSGMMLRRGRE
jgi:hypothetical protein